MKKTIVKTFDVNKGNFEQDVADFYDAQYEKGVPRCYFNFETYVCGHYLVIILHEFNTN